MTSQLVRLVVFPLAVIACIDSVRGVLMIRQSFAVDPRIATMVGRDGAACRVVAGQAQPPWGGGGGFTFWILFQPLHH